MHDTDTSSNKDPSNYGVYHSFVCPREENNGTGNRTLKYGYGDTTTGGLRTRTPGRCPTVTRR